MICTKKKIPFVDLCAAVAGCELFSDCLQESPAEWEQMLGTPGRAGLPLQTHPEHPLWGPLRQQRAQAPEPWGGPAAGGLMQKFKGR